MTKYFLTSCLAACFIYVVSAPVLASDTSSNSQVQIPQSISNHQQAPQLVTVARRTEEHIEIISAKQTGVQDLEIYVPGATFIKLHFSHFHLPRGVAIEVSDPEGREVYRYSKDQKSAHTFDTREGDDGRSRFSAMSITGDTALVRVIGNRGQINSLKHRAVIDYYMEGLSREEVASPAVESGQSFVESGKNAGKPNPQTTCGVNERYDTVCYAGSHPDEVNRSRPVAKILIGGGSVCTAWRVGPGNHLFTNNHCASTQAQIAASEIWFDYQKLDCGGTATAQPVKVTGSQLLQADYTLDYALFTVNNFNSISSFGYLGLETREGELGEQIYIPQHGFGHPKQLAIESDMNVGGLCQIDETDHDAYGVDTDLAYFCDSAGGSSGAPVLSGSSNKVIALHHFGGCFNSGVKMSLIWPQVDSHFGYVVPVGDNEGPVSNQPPQAQFDFSCNALSCNFNAGSSSDPDGNIASYSWSLGDGNSQAGSTIAHTYSAAGSYSVTLNVTDNEGAGDSQSHTVTVEPANASPVASFTVNCADNVCDFDAASSSDSDGTVVRYDWTFGDGASAVNAGSLATHTYSNSGQFSVRLDIADDDGAWSNASATINVSMPPPQNVEPSADFSFSCDELVCQFDGTTSHDPDGLITRYDWDFGDGGTDSGALVSHTFSADGAYNVTLTIEDNAEASNFKTRQVQVAVVAAPGVELSAAASKRRGVKSVDLSWSGAVTPRVNIYRDYQLLVNTANDGAFRDASLSKRTKSVIYSVCEEDGGTCSQEITVKF